MTGSYVNDIQAKTGSKVTLTSKSRVTNLIEKTGGTLPYAELSDNTHYGQGDKKDNVFFYEDFTSYNNNDRPHGASFRDIDSNHYAQISTTQSYVGGKSLKLTTNSQDFYVILPMSTLRNASGIKVTLWLYIDNLSGSEFILSLGGAYMDNALGKIKFSNPIRVHFYGESHSTFPNNIEFYTGSGYTYIKDWTIDSWKKVEIYLRTCRYVDRPQMKFLYDGSGTGWVDWRTDISATHDRMLLDSLILGIDNSSATALNVYTDKISVESVDYFA